jgi:hypothetical protein
MQTWAKRLANSACRSLRRVVRPRASGPRLEPERPQRRVWGRSPSGVRLVFVQTTRSFIDYSLARRAALAALFGGRATVTDVCDAHPYLMRAAKFHGEPTDVPCPVCRKEPLTHVTYTYGDALGQYSGRIRATRELEQLEHEVSEFTVYVVEVCQNCGWNHLRESYVLGHGGRASDARDRLAPQRRATHSRERALSE